MLKLITGLLIVTVMLCGCTTARKTYTSDGKLGYSINCSGNSSTWGSCYERVGEVCGEKGYVILEKIGEAMTSSTGTIIEQHSGSDMNRNMIIRCKE